MPNGVLVSHVSRDTSDHTSSTTSGGVLESYPNRCKRQHGGFAARPAARQQIINPHGQNTCTKSAPPIKGQHSQLLYWKLLLHLRAQIHDEIACFQAVSVHLCNFLHPDTDNRKSDRLCSLGNLNGAIGVQCNHFSAVRERVTQWEKMLCDLICVRTHMIESAMNEASTELARNIVTLNIGCSSFCVRGGKLKVSGTVQDSGNVLGGGFVMVAPP